MRCVQSLRCAWTWSVCDVSSPTLTVFSITVSLWQYWTSQSCIVWLIFTHFQQQHTFYSYLNQPAGALMKPCRHPSRALLLIEVLPRFYDRDLNNSVTPSLPVDFPLCWNFNLISPKFFLPIIRGTFLLIRFIIFFNLSPLMWMGALLEQSAELEQSIRFVC